MIGESQPEWGEAAIVDLFDANLVIATNLDIVSVFSDDNVVCAGGPVEVRAGT